MDANLYPKNQHHSSNTGIFFLEGDRNSFNARLKSHYEARGYKKKKKKIKIKQDLGMPGELSKHNQMHN